MGLSDTREGRAQARVRKKQIEGEVAAGTFDYLKWFPEGAKRRLFAPPASEPPAVPTFERFAQEWLANKKAWFSAATVYDRSRII